MVSISRILFFCLFTQCLFSQSSGTEPRQVIEDFFKAFHVKDTSALSALMADGMELNTFKPTETGEFTLGASQGSDFLLRIAGIPDSTKIEERILDYKVRHDGPLAQVWTPYEFYINGQFSHCGVNAFQLGKIEGRWRIIAIADTRRQTDCP